MSFESLELDPILLQAVEELVSHADHHSNTGDPSGGGRTGRNSFRSDRYRETAAFLPMQHTVTRAHRPGPRVR